MLNPVVFENLNKIGLIRLNNVNALNALTLPMARLIYQKLLEWKSDNSVNMVYIKGEGDRAFCSGGDVKTITTQISQFKNYQAADEFFREEYTLNYEIANYKKPYIAFLNGITMGGGVGLSVHGSHRIAMDSTLFAMPETAIGLIPDVGGSYFLPKLPHNLGLFLGLTGQRLKGIDVYTSGVATHYLAPQYVTKFERELFLSNDTLNKEKLNEILGEYHEKSIKLKKPTRLENLPSSKHLRLSPQNLELIGKFFDPVHFTEAKNPKKTFFDKFVSHLTECYHNSPKDVKYILGPAAINSLGLESSNANSANTNLSQLSPTSLKLTFKLLCDSKSQGWNLNACLIHEFRLVCRCSRAHDFVEGVRAALVDKDNKPNWVPVTLKEVPDSVICQYFEPFKPEEQVTELKLSQ